MLLNKRKRERRENLLRLQQDKERIKQAEEQLALYISTIKEKNKLIESIEKELSGHDVHEVKSDDKPTLQEQLTSIALLTEDDWKKFQALFAQVHPHFFKDLADRYPDLTHGEIRLLALCKLKLSSREMAGMLGISPESLRKGRYRLRKRYPELLQDEDFKETI